MFYIACFCKALGITASDQIANIFKFSLSDNQLS